MGIDIYWQDERGERLGSLPDPAHLVRQFVPPLDAQDFPCLRYVDPAGDTVFNQAQIRQLVWELESLAALKYRFDPKAENHLRDALELVRQAVDQTHTYIKFCGD